MSPAGRYETVIGLEVHVQLSTRSKIFCGCATTFGAPPNSQVCPVCLGLPGVLPVFNKEVLCYAIKAALALSCRMSKTMKFDRKHYFYPDLPKDFQISQYDMPLASKGSLEVKTENGKRTIRINRVHLEEDAGKLIHVEGENSSLVDYNRGGIPLMEIVTEPDITSPQEAYDYLVELKSILKYLEISDCNMEEGSLRCDANVSIRKKGAKALGVKTELKNMNTFKGVKNALEYEVKRQTDILQDGGAVKQDTRLWNEVEARTYSMRSKEEAFDYRYFPEPDLVPFVLEKGLVESIRETLPEMAREKMARFIKVHKLNDASARLLVSDKGLADYFEECAKRYKKPQVIANWLASDIQSELNKRAVSINALGLKPACLAEMLSLIDEGAITGKIAKALLQDMIETGKGPRELVKAKGLSQISDTGELTKIIDKVIALNSKPVLDYKKGKTTAITFLVGQVMKETKGKANPGVVNKMLKERMERL